MKQVWHPTVGQRIDASPNDWTAAGGERDHQSPFLEEEGFTMEDWNFAVGQTFPDPDHPDLEVIGGFGQGTVGERRREAAVKLRGSESFDVVLFTWRVGAPHIRVHGAYADARWFPWPRMEKFRKKPPAAWKKHVAQREAELTAHYPDAPAILARFRDCTEFKWIVRPDRVWRPAKPVEIAVTDLPGYPGRFTNALNWGAAPWWSWAGLASDPYPASGNPGTKC